MPLEKRAKRRSPMAVSRFFFRAQFSKCLLNYREEEERVVTEAVAAPWCFEDDPFGSATKNLERMTIAGGSDHAYESGGALVRRNIS